MRKLIIICILFFSSFSLFSQVEDPNNYSVISEPLSILRNATGYSLQDNGKWAYEPNKIPFTDSRTNRNPTPRRKLGLDNFIDLEIRKVLIENKQYNVLIKVYKDGEYEFPILEQGWKSFNSDEFYVFPALNLNEVLPDEVDFGVPYAINLNAFCFGVVRDYDPENLTEKIVNRINSTIDAKNVNAANLVIAIWPVKEDEQELIKFKLIKTFDKPSITVYYLDPKHAEKIFEKSYYQTPYFKFRDFIHNADIFNLPIEEAPSDFISYYRWGILKYQSGNFDGAIEDFNKALEYNPNTQDFMIYSYMGNCKTKLRDFNSAIENYDRALSLKPTQIIDYSNWVRNYYNRGVAKFYVDDLEGACEDWHKAFENGFGLALEYLNKYCVK
jgi:tetratricopeptide (TPR) repeat protein